MDLRGIEDSLALDALFHRVVASQISALLLWAPILGWGPFGFIVTKLLTHFAEKIFNELKKASGRKFIELAREGLEDKLNVASVALAVMAQEKGIESNEFKEYRKKHIEALSRFARFGKPTS